MQDRCRGSELMKCQNCNEREALVHVTKILNGEKQEFNLCEECAQKIKAFSGDDHLFDFHKFFSGLLDSDYGFSTHQEQRDHDLVCPLCKMKYSTFKKTGKVGCNQCYQVFRDNLSPLVRKIHGSDKHTGKIPNNASQEIKIKKDIEDLNKKLKAAIENEEYELAAQIRDELKLKNQEL